MLQCNEQLYNHLVKLYGGNHYNYRAVMRKVVPQNGADIGFKFCRPETVFIEISGSRRERTQQHYIKIGEPMPDYAAAALEYISFT